MLKDEVDWKLVETETNQDLIKYSDFRSSLNEIAIIFKQIAATHSKILYKNREYSVKINVDKENLSKQWKAKYVSNPGVL